MNMFIRLIKIVHLKLIRQTIKTILTLNKIILIQKIHLAKKIKLQTSL